MEAIDSDGRHLRDERGRIRIFRGANVSGRAKLPPFAPLEHPDRLEALRDWGFNVIRLLVIWEALEPRRGEVDEAYLARVRELAEHAGALGLHVIVDFHQDLFSRELGGDGAPAWAVTTPGRAARGRTWFHHYFTNAGVRRSQDAFWADRDGLQSAFFVSARRLVRALRDVDAVLGYDAWNEPMSRVRAVLGGTFERGHLAAFYRSWIRLRDEEDPERLLFLEPTPLVAFGMPTHLPRPEGERIVYAPHLYDATALGLGRYRPRVSTFPVSLRRILATATRFGTPVLVGEFGVLNGVIDAATMMEHQCRLLDRHFVSWTVWHYDPSRDDWNDEDASIVEPGGHERPWTSALVRPYPRALAGQPEQWDSHPARPWTLTYRPTSGAPTEIVVPRRWRGANLEVEVVGAHHAWAGDILRVESAGAPSITVRLHRA